ncbi:MAG: hypothetical protein H6702_14650 [Myxococcales bacterium]|nr:hypothetical protein [Myxococcales bacterium]
MTRRPLPFARPLGLALALWGCDDGAATPEPGQQGDARVAADGAPSDRGALDRGAFDLGPDDLGPADGQAPDAEPPLEPDPCARALHPDPDRPRVALVAHPFGEEEGRRGHTVAAYPLDPDGRLADETVRVDLGERIIRVRFLPSGELAVALGERGALALLAVTPPDGLQILDQIALAGGGFSDLVVDPDGAFVHVVTRDVGEAAGVYTVAIPCGGGLEPLAEHLSLRLVHGLSLLPGDPDRALLIGGQAVFEPVDPDDTRLLTRRPDGGWAQAAAFDLWADGIDLTGIGIHPAGHTALIPNGSSFSEEGGQVMVLDLTGDAPVEAARHMGMDDARQARYHSDGTALVTRLEPGRVTVFLDEGQGPEPITELRYGLPEDLAILARGALDGVVVLPAVSPQTGSQLVTLRISAPGVVDEIEVKPLPEGSTFIPGSVAVAP